MHMVSALLAKFRYWQVITSFVVVDFHVITIRYHRGSQNNDHLNLSVLT